jgi:hypothetical protein
MPEVRLSGPARQDLLEIWAFIAPGKSGISHLQLGYLSQFVSLIHSTR